MKKERPLRVGVLVTALRAMPLKEDILWPPIPLVIGLCEELQLMGHEVVVYTPSDSTLELPMRSGGLRYGLSDEPLRTMLRKERALSPNEAMNPHLYEQYLVNVMRKDAAAGKLDVMHAHTLNAAPLGHAGKVPMVITPHSPVNPYHRLSLRHLQRHRGFFLAFLTKAQRATAPELRSAGVVHNGFDLDEFPFSAHPDDRLLFCGRIIPDKGVEDAVAVAHATASRLDVAGSGPDAEYLKRIADSCVGDVRYRGLLRGRARAEAYGSAKALLFPVRRNEPFGLVVAEAMACGTPVIAYDRPAARELIDDGVTGFLVRDVRGMRAAVARVHLLDRRACRRRAERMFSVSAMAKGYVRIYRKAIASVR